MPTVNDYIPGVVSKLGNRTDIQSNGLVLKWIVEAVRNLTENYPFVDLQSVGPQYTFTPGVYSYPISKFMQSGDQLGFFDLIFMWYNGTSGPGKALEFRTIPVVENIAQNTSGGGAFPLYWTRYGNNIRIGPMPSQQFYGYALYQKKHPFSVQGFDYTMCGGDPVFLPDEWRDIIEYAAAIKGAPEVQMSEKVPVWTQLVYGNPEKREPGLIYPLVSQFQRDASNNERQLNVVVR